MVPEKDEAMGNERGLGSRAGKTDYTGAVSYSTPKGCGVSGAAGERRRLTCTAAPGVIAGVAQTGVTASGQTVSHRVLTGLSPEIHQNGPFIFRLRITHLA